MGYRIREKVATCQMGQAVTVDALAQVIPQTALEAALDATGVHEQRDRASSPQCPGLPGAQGWPKRCRPSSMSCRACSGPSRPTGRKVRPRAAL